ncbi:MAG: hypothetical protein ABR928_12420, partial [Terracidiphilus sp.]
MKRLAIAILLCAIPSMAQQPASNPSEPSGRYQIVSVTVTAGASSDPDNLAHVVFLLDTKTGQIWRYFAGVGGVKVLKPQDQLDPGAAVSPGAFVL